MAEETNPTPTADRRAVLRATALGVAAAGVGATAAACSSSNSMPQGSNAQTEAAQTGGGAHNGPVTLGTTAEVPVGGGFVSTQYKVVVTQPVAGQYKAFTAVCTHLGCTVGSVKNNVIQCPCHFSQFSAKDGSVVQGPATSSLSTENITVQGSNIIWNA